MENKVKEKRLEKKLSQQELANISKVSRTTINAIETGKLKEIRSTTMFKLSKALGYDIGDIFFEETVVFTQQ